jgi:hypothetical protein
MDLIMFGFAAGPRQPKSPSEEYRSMSNIVVTYVVFGL